ncbi:Alpha/beta_hydrolase family protein [Hexamita inflata]|uniref:Alpha/beta hydrolase family protein n=1 Tax=Hexamita inflata TaxID=28002 RepID=A0AA86P1U3_9EUKA|nr:Alpha/beta hydrolase family protein [Hexamita inflata]
MGSIINEFAFPVNTIPQIHAPIKDLRTISVKTGMKKEHIQVAVYEPVDPEMMKTRPTVIYIHGNGETIYLMDELIQQYTERFACRFVTFDWCGYGQSTGKPSEQTLTKSALATYNYVKTEFHLTDSNIVVWGRSIGTVGSIYLGSMFNMKCCIAQSPPASAFDVVWENPKCNCVNQFMSYKRIKRAQGQIVVIHGTADEVVPFRNSVKIVKSYAGVEDLKLNEVFHGVLMAEAKSLKFYVIQEGGHNDLDNSFADQLEFCLAKVLEPEEGNLVAEKL